mmetsp:Transcript_9027/g.15080  ORF Transcript_9027/g.15080 Transcript_9027/m.15080 type:complete len:146 (-) Transcript_9027:177-614(-)|eukprot:CAMPEP_0119013288 /NCGR_PEP_ID=MMETSP1176-20130426/8324_1 /TAXON_ID=265551 /ORGANISM="Synedropsis recta cf, Strain CCMP1620" /LENGTH=145 /DNA_ID=CAMNT_0006966369 /DNA_START=77 /DNA_END=514 /DNA_ORIENTATION=+
MEEAPHTNWESLPLAELKPGTKGVKAEVGEEEKMRTASVSVLSSDGSTTEDVFVTLTTQRLLLSNKKETRYFAVSNISNVDTVGKKKTGMAKMMGKQQEYKLVMKTGTSGDWTFVFNDTFPGSIRKVDAERDAWAEAILAVTTQQ